MTDQIKLSQLEALVAAVEAGGFSAASVELGCTQSRISHSIAELERYLGVRLLVRTRAGCTPTQVGQRVLAHARRMLQLAQEIGQESRDHVGLRGTVRIASIRSTATHLLPHVVEALERECPGVHIEVFDGCHSYGEVTTMIERGLADVGITRSPQGSTLSRISVQPLVSDRYVVVAPASMRLSSPANWKELAKTPLIHLQQPGAQWIVEQCLNAGMSRHRVRELVNESGIVAMVSRGLGYAVLPRLTVFPDAPGTQVLELPFRALRQLVVCQLLGHSRNKATDIVMEFIRSKTLIMQTEAWKAGVLTCDL
ncbi:LysR family transcriptional regulator [Curvibacter gracilis]|uniref:LysR family transcriptional regulator n=1 Tax=Curvibacter gracilis TaxID=230310 RepID=UPI0009FF3AC2|nr:LysR family transcriptional regulator [Curvibacter gracilis]